MPFIPIGEMTGLKVPGMDVPVWADDTVETLFEPDARSVLAYLLGHYLNVSVYLTLLNAKASEHSARMVAMKNATDSAEELVRSLTLGYNRLRQGNITRELLDIAGGQAG
jgi:F-type H+-transporting ATPase subunit gamma